jgi:hypothetical protein
MQPPARGVAPGGQWPDPRRRNEPKQPIEQPHPYAGFPPPQPSTPQPLAAPKPTTPTTAALSRLALSRLALSRLALILSIVAGVLLVGLAVGLVLITG